MTAPMAQLFCNQRGVTAKKDELHITIHAKTVAIFSFESGTCEDRVLSRSEGPFDLLAQTFQPWRPVFVR